MKVIKIKKLLSIEMDNLTIQLIKTTHCPITLIRTKPCQD